MLLNHENTQKTYKTTGRVFDVILASMSEIDVLAKKFYVMDKELLDKIALYRLVYLRSCLQRGATL